MFEILPSPSLESILIVVRALMLMGAFGVFALAFTRWRRADERDAERLHTQLERAFAEMRSLHESVTVMSARLESVSERAESESRLAPAGNASSQRGYDLAARLARNGADAEELVASCGITRHEAELLARLHAPKRREVAAPPVRQSLAHVEQPAALTRPVTTASQNPHPQAAAGRKRGSLLSVVG